MDLILQLRDIEWLNGWKTQYSICIAYKKLISPLGTCIDWKWKDRVSYLCKWNEKRAGVAILT
jgi:hypothetical protein